MTLKSYLTLLLYGWLCLGLATSAATQESPQITSGSQTDSKSKITIQKDDKKLTFLAGKQPVLVYNHQVVQPPDGIDAMYARSGHIHPLYTPKGKIVTDDFSDDHAHQHGLFYAFVKAKVDGETLDFWNQHRRNANVKCDGIQIDPRIPNRVITKQVHYRMRDKKPVFNEEWHIQVSLRENCFVIDLESRLSNVSGSKVKIEKNHYGSFGLRGSGQWRKAEKTEFDFVTSKIKNRKNGNLVKENWVAMQGKIGGEICGVAVVGHPDNFRHPQPARLHPTMPYFSFAPMASGDYELADGVTQTTRFRIITFDGRLDRKKIESLK